MSDTQVSGQNIACTFTDQEKDRLFAHALHEDTIYHERLNFFVVFESVLLGIVAALHGSQRPVSTWSLVLLTICGISITGFWVHVQWYQRAIVLTLLETAETNLPEFAKTRSAVRARRGPVGRLRASAVLTFGIPFIVLVMWLLLLGMILTSPGTRDTTPTASKSKPGITSSVSADD
ncbi:MAG TPA: hypothetical protein VFQ45_07960 [Longimicrobium sp.]|nr:hypothetical protein [Longimicrobium sp.]